MTLSAYPATIPAPRRWRFPLWTPFLLVWLLLLPFALLLALLVFFACAFFRVNPFRGVAVCWRLYGGLRGVRVTLDDPRVPLSIRIF